MAPLQGVLPGETATLDLVTGPRYQKIMFEGTVTPDAGSIATVADIIGLIKVTINGKTQRQFTVDELNALNTLNGYEFDVEPSNLTDPGTAAANGDRMLFRVNILFGEPFRKSYFADKMMAWPTAWPGGVNLGTFQVEVEVPEVAGYTGHSISAYAEIDSTLGAVNEQGTPVFNISKWWRQTIVYTAAGELYITTLPKRGLYQAMHFFSQVGDDITHIKIVRDGTVILDVPKSVNDNNLRVNGITATLIAGRLDIIFDRDDLPESALPMDGVAEFQVILTLGNAAATNKAITLITENYGPRD